MYINNRITAITPCSKPQTYSDFFRFLFYFFKTFLHSTIIILITLISVITAILNHILLLDVIFVFIRFVITVNFGVKKIAICRKQL